MNELARMAIRLGLDVADYERGLTDVESKAKRTAGKLADAFGGAFSLVTGGAAASVTGLAGLAIASAKGSAEIGTMSDRLGVSAEFLSRYNAVIDMSSVSMDAFTSGVSDLQRSINDAFTGNQKTIESFNAIGLSLDDIADKNPEEQFELVAEAIGKLESQSEKAAAANDLLGDSSGELLSVFNLTKSELDDLKDSADRYGNTISDIEAQQAGELFTAFNNSKQQMSGLFKTISTELTPAITEVLKGFNEWFGSLELSGTSFQVVKDGIAGVYASILAIDVALKTIGEAFGIFVGVAIEAFELPGKALDIFLKRIQRGGLIIASVFDDVADNAQADLGREIAAMEANLGKAFDGFSGDAGEEIKDFVNRTIKEFGGVVDGFEKISKAGEDTAKVMDKKVSTVTKRLTADTKKLREEMQSLVTDAFERAQAVLNDFNDVAQSVETPIENLNRVFNENVAAVAAFMNANMDNAEQMEEADKVLQRLIENYMANKDAIEGNLQPMQRLLQDLQTEIYIKNGTIQLTDRMVAARELERMKLVATNEELDLYIQKMKELASMNGTFGNGINSFEQLIQVSIEGKEFFKDMREGFSNMFGQGAGNAAEGFGSMANFAEGVLGFWDSTAGQDGAGRILDTINQIAGTGILGPIAQAVSQIASFVDSLTGGNLFGTSYENTGGSNNISIAASGVDGTISTNQSRRRSLFRGTQRRTLTESVSSDVLAQLDAIRSQMGELITNAAIAVGTDLAESLDIVAGTFTTEFDKDGNISGQFSEVLGRIYQETEEQFNARLAGENILAGVGTQFDEVDQLADRFRGTGTALLDFAQFALQAGADIQAGAGLFNTLTGTLTAISDTMLAKPGETLIETYSRVSAATSLYEGVLGELGVELDYTRIEFVRFSAGIVEAAGGLEQAAGLWASYFETFYTEQERAERTLESATANRDSLLGDIGIDTNINVEQFRELFESVLPDLSAEAVVNWLNAADAIGAVISAEQSLAETRGELSSFIGNIESDLENMGLSEFARSLKDITLAYNENMATARRLGASEQQFAVIRARANAQIRQAIALLENDISNSIADLYGTQLDNINEQISALEEQGATAGQVNQANMQRYASELQAIENIQGFLDNLTLDRNLSPLNPQQQLAEAMSQFDEMFAQAQGGDIDALNALPALAQTLLGFGRDVFASSPEYTALFDDIFGRLGSLDAGESPESQIIGQNQQMIELMSQRNALEAASNADNSGRLLAVTELALKIGELTSVTDESFASLADRLGLPVEQFLGDLGVSLDDLTAETVVALGDVANLLGIELPELASSVNVALGNLEDQNSLINDALEMTIQALPSGIQDSLAPLLTAIERETDPAAREALLQQFVDIADALPADQRDLLAPFFEQIDPLSEAQQQIDQMVTLNTTNEAIRNELAESNFRQEGLVSNLNDEVREQSSAINRLAGNVRDLLFAIESGGITP